MALDQSALSELLEALKSGDDLDFMRRAMEVVLQLLIELEATEKIGAGRYEAGGGPHDAPEREPVPVVVDQGRGREPADPQAPPGQLLPLVARAAPADRQGAVGGGHGGLRPWGVDPQGRRFGPGAGDRGGDLQERG